MKRTARSRPEPDIIALWPGVTILPSRATWSPDEVALAVEIVSPSSEERDQITKPAWYAEVGIPYYWIVEDQGDGVPMVSTFALSRTRRRYVEVAVARETLQVEQPFPIKFDVDELYP